MQLKPVRNTELCNYNPPACNLAQACTCHQTHVQMKHSLAHLQDLIPTWAGVVAYQDTRLCVSGQERHVVHKCVIYRNR